MDLNGGYSWADDTCLYLESSLNLLEQKKIPEQQKIHVEPCKWLKLQFQSKRLLKFNLSHINAGEKKDKVPNKISTFKTLTGCCCTGEKKKGRFYFYDFAAFPY